MLRASLSYTGAASGMGAAYLAVTRPEATVGVAALAAVMVMAFAGRLHLADLLALGVPDRGKVARVAGAFLVVSAGVVGAIGAGGPASPVGTAEASHGCDYGDVGLMATLNYIGAMYTSLTCAPLADHTDINTTDTDASQVKARIAQTGLSTASGNDVFLSTFSNALTDANTTALIVGKNAYIRALANGSTKQVAMSEAKMAISDYYATRQVNLLKKWETTVIELRGLNNTKATEQGIDKDFINPVSYETSSANEDFDGWPTKSVNLVNGSDHSVVSMRAHYGDDSVFNAANPATGNVTNQYHDGVVIYKVNIKSTSTTDKVDYLRLGVWHDKWTQIQTQEDQARQQIETFVDGTYDQWKAGAINTSELVDPYLGARNYAPSQGYQTWAISSLASLGYSAPVNLSNVGHMTISPVGKSYDIQGVLMSDGVPASGEFEVGKTYNASQLQGVQYVVTEDSRVELEGEFVVEEAVTYDGTNQTSIAYRTPDYDTASLDGYKQLMEALSEYQASVEQREEQMEGGGSGGGSWMPQANTAAIVLLAGAALFLIGRTSGD